MNQIADYESFAAQTLAAGNEKDVEIMVPLKYLSSFG